MSKHAAHLLPQHHLRHLLLVECRLRCYHVIHLRLRTSCKRIPGRHAAEAESGLSLEAHHRLHLGHLRHLRHCPRLHARHSRHARHPLHVLLLARLLGGLLAARELLHRSSEWVVDLWRYRGHGWLLLLLRRNLRQVLVHLAELVDQVVRHILLRREVRVRHRVFLSPARLGKVAE